MPKRKHDAMASQTTTPDLQVLANQVLLGKEPHEVMLANPQAWKYQKALERIKLIRMRSMTRTEAPLAIFLYAHKSVDLSGVLGVFDVKTVYNKVGKLFKNYNQQKVCVIPALRSRTTGEATLLRLADEYQCPVDIGRRGYVPFVSQVLIVMSTKPIEKVYPKWLGTFDNFHRRYLVFKVTQDANKTTYWPERQTPDKLQVLKQTNKCENLVTYLLRNMNATTSTTS